MPARKAAPRRRKAAATPGSRRLRRRGGSPRRPASAPSTRGLTQAGYARHRARLGLPGATREAVRKAVRDGKLGLAVDSGGRIDAQLADRAWIANSAGRRQPPTPEEGQLRAATSYRAASEARRAYWAAEREEMSARREAGLLVPVEEVRAAAAEAARNVATQLQGIRRRLASTLAAMDDVSAIDRLLEEEHRHACASLSGDASFGGATPPGSPAAFENAPSPDPAPAMGVPPPRSRPAAPSR